MASPSGSRHLQTGTRYHRAPGRDPSAASLGGLGPMWANLERDPSTIGWVAEGFSGEV